MKRILLAVIPALFLVGLVGACGKAPDSGGIASAQTAAPDSSGASAAPSPSGSPDPQKFAQCMRKNGIDMPDPGANGDISIRIGGGKPGKGGPSKEEEAKVERALEACKAFNPIGDMDQAPDPAFQDAVLKFAKCMRDHGVDFPDPEVSGRRVKMGGPNMHPESPTFQKAQKACEPLMPGRPGGPGGGPAGSGGGQTGATG